MMNNPQVWKLAIQEPIIPKIDNPSKNKECANLAIKQIVLEEREFGFLVEDDCPTSIKEVINSDEGEHWRKAMEEEMETLKKMGTWTLKDLPKDCNAIGVKTSSNQS